MNKNKNYKFFKVCYLGTVEDEKEFEIINNNFSILEQTIKLKYFRTTQCIAKKHGIIESECYHLYLLVPKNIDNDTINEAIKPYGFVLRSAEVRKITFTKC